jgi:putative heme-binding domain-containing protein
MVTALGASPGLRGVRPSELRAALASFGEEVQAAARPVFAKLEASRAAQLARVTELEPALATGDPRRGGEVFVSAKANCAACHAIAGQGGAVGPDLTKIGSVRTARDLLEALIAPSTTFARGYEPFIVTTKDGHTFSGVVARETAEAIVLVTGPRQEEHIERSNIDRLRPGDVSVMPDGLDAQLSKQEVADLVAYLKALK